MYYFNVVCYYMGSSYIYLNNLNKIKYNSKIKSFFNVTVLIDCFHCFKRFIFPIISFFVRLFLCCVGRDSFSWRINNNKVRKEINDSYVWAGLSYTFLNDQFFVPNAIAPLVGLKKDNLYMSYGFSINMNKTQDFNYGTHMITLGFDYERRPSLARCTQDMMIF